MTYSVRLGTTMLLLALCIGCPKVEEKIEQPTVGGNPACPVNEANACKEQLGKCWDGCADAADIFKCPCACWKDFKTCYDNSGCGLEETIKAGKVRDLPECSCQAESDCAKALSTAGVKEGTVLAKCGEANVCEGRPCGEEKCGVGGRVREPVKVLLGQPAEWLASGNEHVCALMLDRTVQCWGHNDSGQIGQPTATHSGTPLAVSGITGAVDIAAGSYHSCVVLSDSKVRCWGYNELGQLGDGTTAPSGRPVEVNGVDGAKRVDAGFRHSCAVLRSGGVVCWGGNVFGQLGNGSTAESQVPVPVTGITSAKAIALGDSFSCALVSDGTVRCWGRNQFGQLGNGSTQDSPMPVVVQGITSAQMITAGSAHACAGLTTGAIRCWGVNGAGQLGNGLYDDSAAPVQVGIPGVWNPATVSAGYGHTCATTTGGSIYCWGANLSCQLGDGTTCNAATPLLIPTISNALEVAVGADHSCALLKDGTARCWGLGTYGQLGSGS